MGSVRYILPDRPGWALKGGEEVSRSYQYELRTFKKYLELKEECLQQPITGLEERYKTCLEQLIRIGEIVSGQGAPIMAVKDEQFSNTGTFVQLPIYEPNLNELLNLLRLGPLV